MKVTVLNRHADKPKFPFVCQWNGTTYIRYKPTTDIRLSDCYCFITPEATDEAAWKARVDIEIKNEE